MPGLSQTVHSPLNRTRLPRNINWSPYFSVRSSRSSTLRYGRPSWMQWVSNLLQGRGRYKPQRHPSWPGPGLVHMKPRWPPVPMTILTMMRPTDLRFTRLSEKSRPLILDVTSDHCFAVLLKIPNTLYTFLGTIVNRVVSVPLPSYMYVPFLTKMSYFVFLLLTNCSPNKCSHT